VVDPVLDAFTALAAVALVAAATYAALSIRDSAHAAKYARALRYMERLFDFKFIEEFTAASAIWGFRGNEIQRLQNYRSLSPTEQASFCAVLNFFEEVSAAYNAGLLDEGMMKRMISGYLILIWERAGWFIANAKLRDERTFCEWGMAREHFLNT
jgi:hypothetical protein